LRVLLLRGIHNSWLRLHHNGLLSNDKLRLHNDRSLLGDNSNKSRRANRVEFRNEIIGINGSNSDRPLSASSQRLHENSNLSVALEVGYESTMVAGVISTAVSDNVSFADDARRVSVSPPKANNVQFVCIDVVSPRKSSEMSRHKEQIEASPKEPPEKSESNKNGIIKPKNRESDPNSEVHKEGRSIA